MHASLFRMSPSRPTKVAAFVHNPVPVRDGRGWIVECTCGRTDLGIARLQTKARALADARSHVRVQVEVGGAVTVSAARDAGVPVKISADGYVTR